MHWLTPFAQQLRAAVCWTVAFLFLTACGGVNTPVATIISQVVTSTPRPLPETRTAPTLPPIFTATATATVTLTPTSTLTATETATLTVEDICADLTLPTAQLEDATLEAGKTIPLSI